jgi:hypothetical protein
MLDTFGYVSLGLFGPLAIGVIVRALPVIGWVRIGIATVLTAWFVFTAIAPLRGAVFGIILPVVAAPFIYAASATARAAVAGMHLPSLIALHISRLAGGFFILLHADGRLANPFAAAAGWGDLLAATLAIPAAIIAYRAKPGWEKWVLAWNVIGFTDFLSAVFFGATSQPGSPIQLFFEPPGAALLGQLPWRFIPGYFVPLYLIIHVAIFVRLWPARLPVKVAPATSNLRG